MTDVAKIKSAIRGVHAAKEKLSAVVEDQFPLGADVHWEKGGHRQHGIVLAHGSSGRLRVENGRTYKNYWIGMFDVFGYVE